MHLQNIIISLLIGPICATAHTVTKTVVENLYRDMLTNYSRTDIRPIYNQSEPLRITVHFEVISLVMVDEVAQVFEINGYLRLNWTDEFLKWNPLDYSGVAILHPRQTEIYTPHLQLINTMTVRDVFKTVPAPLYVEHTGIVHWVPGSLFLVTCQMDMENFPSDVQTCQLRFLPMNLDHLEFEIKEQIGYNAFTQNGEWEIRNSTLRIENGSFGTDVMKDLVVEFTIKRREAFFHLNLLIPVILIGLLNSFVFVIPLNSGESIGYSTTVVLSLTVYIDVVTQMIPKTSDTIALLVHFLFAAFLLSVMAAIVTVLRTWLHHQDEENQENPPHPSPNGISDRDLIIALTRSVNLSHLLISLTIEEQSRILKGDTQTGLNHRLPFGQDKMENILLGMKYDQQDPENGLVKPVTEDIEDQNKFCPPGQRSKSQHKKANRLLTFYQSTSLVLDKICFPCFLLIYTGIALYFLFKISA